MSDSPAKGGTYPTYAYRGERKVAATFPPEADLPMADRVRKFTQGSKGTLDCEKPKIGDFVGEK